jgi:hypothetical protein
MLKSSFKLFRCQAFSPVINYINQGLLYRLQSRFFYEKSVYSQIVAFSICDLVTGEDQKTKGMLL